MLDIKKLDAYIMYLFNKPQIKATMEKRTNE